MEGNIRYDNVETNWYATFTKVGNDAWLFECHSRNAPDGYEGPAGEGDTIEETETLTFSQVKHRAGELVHIWGYTRTY